MYCYTLGRVHYEIIFHDMTRRPPAQEPCPAPSQSEPSRPQTLVGKLPYSETFPSDNHDPRIALHVRPPCPRRPRQKTPDRPPIGFQLQCPNGLSEKTRNLRSVHLDI